MAVFVNQKPADDLQIQVVEKNGEVHLVYNNHAFAVCKTVDGEHAVQIYDVDGGGIPKSSNGIRILCWRR